jgi:hypothetical protein
MPVKWWWRPSRVCANAVRKAMHAPVKSNAKVNQRKPCLHPFAIDGLRVEVIIAS